MKKKKRILVVEDERATHQTIRLYLEHDGYEVDSAWDGAEARQKIDAYVYDLLVLDLMLPHIDGSAISRMVRKGSDVPIIMLTARSTEEDKLAGLELGADDYITKPFSPRELVARVRAVLRRAAPDTFNGIEELAWDDVVMNLPQREVVVGGEIIHLTYTEFNLLACFLRAPRRTFTREELINQALGPDAEALERTIDAHVMNLRKKIERRRPRTWRIGTVFGVGYRLEPA